MVDYFNPRSREGSDIPPLIFQILHDHFNPRSREGSDHKTTSKFHVELISIHAPVKGATVKPTDHAVCGYISIHAPVKGATGEPPGLGGFDGISIHAPVKGATVTGNSATCDDIVFQSTLP